MKRATTFDIAVAGAGPAGLAVAAEAAELGLSVALIDPRVDEPWTQTFGAFADELRDLGLADAIANRWSRPLLWTGSDPRTLDRAYARLHNPTLRGALLERSERAGVARFQGRVHAIASGDRGEVVLWKSGSVTARAVVDATGTGLRRFTSSCRVAQVALGRVVELARTPWADDELVWMDFRSPEPEERPTFLYALPLGEGRVLLEETSLASAPPMGFDELERRLDRRIERMGLQVDRVVETERVFIPLDRPVSGPTGRVVAFGAAAGFVHPSTGYSIVRSLRAAPAFARALAEGLEIDGTAAARRAHAAAWPTRLKASRALHEGGLQVLLSLDAAHTRRFFDTFFDLPPDLQAAWLDPTGSPARVATAMAVLFGQTSWGVRSDIFYAAMDRLSAGIGLPATHLGGPA